MFDLEQTAKKLMVGRETSFQNKQTNKVFNKQTNKQATQTNKVFNKQTNNEKSC